MINEMRPHYPAALTVTPVPGTVLYRQVQRGEFWVLDPFETLEEMKIMLEAITADSIKFVGLMPPIIPIQVLCKKIKRTC